MSWTRPTRDDLRPRAVVDDPEQMRNRIVTHAPEQMRSEPTLNRLADENHLTPQPASRPNPFYAAFMRALKIRGY